MQGRPLRRKTFSSITILRHRTEMAQLLPGVGQLLLQILNLPTPNDRLASNRLHIAELWATDLMEDIRRLVSFVN